MEATGRDGGAGVPSWSYRRRHEEIGSSSYTISSSSRSGTIVSSTAYTSGASRRSLSADFELKVHEDIEKEHECVIELVNGGVNGWFTKLEVAWVLDLDDDAFVREIQRTDNSQDWIGRAPTWIHALAEIVATMRFTRALPLPNQFFLRRVTSKILQTVRSKLFFTNEVVTDDRASIPNQIQFARFTQVAMLKLLAFVDALVDVNFGQKYSIHSGTLKIHSYHTVLNLLLDVHGALSKASQVIDELFFYSKQGEVQRILGEIFPFLSTKEDKALHAICLTLNDCTTHVLRWIQYLSDTKTSQQGSSDIHTVTWAVLMHIIFLVDNKSSLELNISEADDRGKVSVYKSRIGNQKHFDSMMIIMTMASGLEEGLASLSETFLDQGLRFLFLLNNSDQLHRCLLLSKPGGPSLQLYAESLFTKVDGYMQSYLQVSWAPVLSCLFNPTPRFLGKNYSPLTRFESEFQETYITQKHWKVPDPKVRKNLRMAIIEQIIPGYTKYIEENNITTPRLAPQELEEMLQDLFEG